MKQVASLRYGVIFKKAFCVPEIFTAFVRDFLDIELKIDQVETEKSFPQPIGRVQSRFDLFAEDKENRVIVDIQHARYADHYDRFLHYHCAALLEQIANSKDYHPELKVFTLVVLTSGDKHKKDIGVIDFDPKDRNGKPFGEIAHKVIYICPKYLQEDTPSVYREWLEAIEDSLDEEVDETRYTRPEIHQIFDLIEKDQVTPEERARMFDEYGEEQLKQDQFAKGIEKGHAKGLSEGIEKGKLETALKTAKEMLHEGMDIRLISKITKLSEEVIIDLKNKI